jgi:predicted nucleotidyltransferase
MKAKRLNRMMFSKPAPRASHGGVIARKRGFVSQRQIKAYCRAVVREFQPEKIILFGSYAYGNPTWDSDVDLLVVMPFPGNDVSKAIQIRARFDAPFALDLLVRKPAFINRRLKERDMFIEQVVRQGRVLYEGKHA